MKGIRTAILQGIASLMILHDSVLVATPLRSRGEDLFTGKSPLMARMRGAGAMLDPSSATCANCHWPSPLPGPGSPTTSTAGEIGDGWLLESRSRRGGPKSRYDLSAFCVALRTGIDPVRVQIPQLMPSYVIDDKDCEALWIFLGGKT